MASDSRSRSRRNVKTETKTRSRLIDGGTSTFKIYGNNNPGKSGKNVADNQRYFSLSYHPNTDPNYGGFEKDGQYAISDNGNYESGAKFTLFDGRSAVFHDDSKRTGSAVAGGYLEVTNQNPDKRVSETYTTQKITAKDRFGESDAGQDGKDASIKRKGRSALRIKKAGDASASRLKPKGVKEDKRVGVQGGGKSGNGLNIPR